MIPILYDRYETAFASNGLGRLADCISCTVTEERNGIYECQFTYPVTGEMFPEIQEGRIIAVIHDDAKDIQPFDIYAHSAPLNGVVTFYAHHISYRLGSVILKPMQAASCVAALNAIPSNTYNRCPFTFWTDKAVSAQWENKVPSAVKAILGGQQGSILDVYGKGEYQWDKWLVRLYVNRGNDNGVSIRYGVNLTDLEQDYDESGSYNAVAPYWINSEDGTVVTLSKGIVSVSSGTRLVPWTTQSGEEITDRAGNTIYFKVSNPVTPVPMDLSEAFDTQPTEAQLEAEALRRLNSSEAWLPSENITVKFVNLADTEEYRNVAALQRVSLCDRVSVYCGPLNVSAVKMQVIRVVYNVLTERYDEIELGKAKTSFAQTITAKVEEMTKDLPTMSMMRDAINNASDRITGAMGGHVRFIYDANSEMQEILIMDTDDVNTAVNVWRWNSGGFGFSPNGYAGPYDTAITMDGAIVADFITAGHAMFNILKGGTLTLGGNDNGNGVLTVKDASGNTIGTWNNTGLTLNKGSIAGPSITLGGNNNADGTLAVKDASGNTIGTWNKDGISIYKGSITGGTINGALLTLGGANNGSGTLIVKDASNNTIGTWNNTGLTLNKGIIAGSSVTLGGSNNTDGTLTVKDANNNIIGIFDKDGLNIYKGIISGATLNSASGDTTLQIKNGEIVYFNSYRQMLRMYIQAVLDDHSQNYFNYIIASDSVTLQAANARLTVGADGTSRAYGNFTGSKFWFNSDIYVYNNLEVGGNLTVSGTKPRLVTTQEYGKRLLYCYETPTPMFGDVGEGVIGDDGLCYITLEAVFAQTIVTDQYQVFLQKYGPGDCWVRERKGAYFIVEGMPGLSFGWEVKAKQRDYDQLRLERNDKFTIQTQTYGEDAAKHIDDIRKEREVA